MRVIATGQYLDELDIQGEEDPLTGRSRAILPLITKERLINGQLSYLP